MSQLRIKHHLVNDKHEDPGLYIEVPQTGDYILFDIGNIHKLDRDVIKKITKVFITHTHMDHFIGFDTLLRYKLGKPHTVEIFGINPLADNVYSKLQGYTWNLVEFEPQLIFKVKQIKDNLFETFEFDIKKKFAKDFLQEQVIENDVIYENKFYRVRYAVLDHKIEVLGYSFEYKDRLLLKKDKVEKLPLKGKEFGLFKNFLENTENIDKTFNIAGKDYSYQELFDEYAYIQKGIKISYITDIIYSPQNKEKVIKLVENSDYLYCESVFTQRDIEQAKKVYHLTTKQTAQIASEANVKNLIVFHFSRRYGKNKDVVLNQIKKFFPNVS